VWNNYKSTVYEGSRKIKYKTYKAYSYRSSSSPGVMYTTLLLDNGEITCNCPGWTRRVAEDGSRTCKHCEDVKSKKEYKDFLIAMRFILICFAGVSKDSITAFYDIEARKLVELTIKDVLSKGGPVEIDSTETKEGKSIVRLDVSTAEQVEKMFRILREYGYLCFRNYYHKRKNAIHALNEVIEKRKAKDIPVSGCIWIDREWTKGVDSGYHSFKMNALAPVGNNASVIHGEVSEAARRCDLKVTSSLSDLASFGFIYLEKIETILPL